MKARKMRRLAIGLCCALSLAAPALAQERILHVGLREDPDLLDPTLGSSYVGRIVFSGLCDKLFDIDANLNIVPMLATGYEWTDPTHLVIHIRDGVRFQDGEKLDAEAVKYKLMRDLTAKGSMRRGEVNSIDSIDVLDPLTVRLNLKAPAAQLLAQLTDRAGIMISPKAAEAAGDKFGLHPVCAGPFSFDSRVAQDRIVLRALPGLLGRQVDPLRRGDLSAQPELLGAAGKPAGRRAGYRRVYPADRRAGGAARSEAEDGDRRFARLHRHLDQHRQRTGARTPRWAGTRWCARRSSSPGSPGADPGCVFGHVYADDPGQSARVRRSSSRTCKVPARDVAKAKALLKQAGVPTPVPVTLTITNGSDIQQAGEVIQSMASEAGFDVKIKAMEFASSLQAAYAGDFQAYLIGWSGRSDPDGNMWQMLHYRRHVQLRPLQQRRCRQGAGRCAHRRRGGSAASVLRQGVGRRSARTCR